MDSLLKKYQENVSTSIVISNFNASSVVNKLKEYKTPITLATTLILLKYIYGSMFSPPKKLKHIPHVNFISFIRKILQGVPYRNIAKELIVPLYEQKKKSEMYLKRDLLGWTIVVVNPEDAKQVFLKTDIFKKAELPLKQGTLIHTYFGNKNIIFASDKNEWKKHRMTVNPAFHQHMPVKLFAEYTHRVFDIIDNSNESTIDIQYLMERFTLDVIGKAGFDFDFNSLNEKNNEWVDTYHAIKNGADDPIFIFFPFFERKLIWLFPHRKYLRSLVAKFHSMLDRVIENKRQHLKAQKEKSNIENAEKDLLTLMLEGELSGQRILTDDELRSNLNIFFIAGHDTTSNTLQAAIYHLAKHQDIQQRAREEAISILGDEPTNVFPTVEQTKKMVYINQIMKETLRIDGPVTQITPRITQEDTELSGTFIPKGFPIVVNLHDLHHNSNVWNDPYTFNPDRFSSDGEAVNKEREGLSWVPFANGPRICIGMNFSLTEQRVLLSSLLRKYEWHLPEDTIHSNELVTTNIGVLSPIDLKIVFKPRY